jgi:hypothetical protein
MSDTPKMPPIKIAFIIDNKVVDILHTDERLGAIFLSQPVIVDVTDKFKDGLSELVLVDATYDEKTGEFTPPTKD